CASPLLQGGNKAVEIVILGLCKHCVDQRRQSGRLGLAQQALEHVAKSQIVQQAHFRPPSAQDCSRRYNKHTRNSSQAPLCTRMPTANASLAQSRRQCSQSSLDVPVANARHRKNCPFICTRGRQICSYFRNSSGTLPPFSASFCITCLCSQIFMDA